MNQAEAELLIAEAVIAGAVLPTASAQDLADKAGVWADFCDDVPYEFARQVVRGWPTGNNHFLTPNRLSNEWRDHRRASATGGTFPEGACAWARVCRCDHDACFHGQLRGPEDKTTVIETPKGEIHRYTTAVRWCPTCWEARNVIRNEQGMESRAYGDMGR